MNDKPFFKQPTFYLIAAAVLFALINLIVYATTGATMYNKGQLAAEIIAMDIVAIVLGVATLVFDLLVGKVEVLGKFAGYSRFVKYVTFLVLLFGFLMTFITEFNFIGNVFVGTDPVDPTYIVNYIFTVVTELIAAASAIVAGVLHKNSVYKAEKEEASA